MRRVRRVERAVGASGLLSVVVELWCISRPLRSSAPDPSGGVGDKYDEIRTMS
jgi:hypothetical protein